MLETLSDQLNGIQPHSVSQCLEAPVAITRSRAGPEDLDGPAPRERDAATLLQPRGYRAAGIAI
jgi:hypothetical protein